MTDAAGAAGSNGIVRPAKPQDATRIAELQIGTWRDAYGHLLPASVLGELDLASAIEAWSAAAEMPPTPRHHLLVAVDTATDTVVGFAALTPASDTDAQPSDGEIAVLLVDPEQARLGHGSRLLAASVDVLRADGCTRAVTWLLTQDDSSRALLTSAGWGADGSTRALEAPDGHPVRQLRLHTDLTQEPDGHSGHQH
jgi:GNAT superfamily N-acetyltransferase